MPHRNFNSLTHIPSSAEYRDAVRFTRCAVFVSQVLQQLTESLSLRALLERVLALFVALKHD